MRLSSSENGDNDGEIQGDNDDEDDDDDDDDDDRVGKGSFSFGDDHDEDDDLRLNGDQMEDEKIRKEEVDSMMRTLQENARQEMEKAKHVEMQNKLWQRLLAMRIKMQGLLTSANLLPAPEDADDLRMHLGEDLRSDLGSGLKQLADLRCALLGHHPEMQLDRPLPPLPDSHDSESWWSWLAQSNAASREIEAQVVKSSNERANLQSGRAFKAFGRPLMEQITHSLAQDREKLIRRTQLNRSGVPPLRSKRAREGAKQEPYHDDNIFDDSEFYGQLLKSFLESSSSVTGGKVMARDTRIKKARLKKSKISMAIQEKLLNFMAPTASNVLPPMADALFSSLFGQTPKQ